MAKKRQTEVVFRIRSDVRQRFEACELDGVERYNFELLLRELRHLLRHHEGLLPEAVPDRHIPGRFSISRSALGATYERELVRDPRGNVRRIAITFVGLTCARSGRPTIEM